MVRPPQVCAAQVGPPGQVGHGEMAEGSEEATGCLGHKGNGLEQSDEEKTKGICKDRPMPFSVAAD